MKHSARVGAAAAPRQRPREAQEAITGDDLPLVSYEQYYECGWPSIVRTATVEYKFEVFTKGLGPDWARGGSGGAYGDSNDLAALMMQGGGGDDGEQINLLESLNTYVPAQAQSILGVEECRVRAEATQRVFDGTSGGLRHRQRALALQGEGIVQILARGSRYDDNVGECDGDGDGDGEDGVVCTPLKSYSTIVFDPEVTDERHASQVVMTAITEAVTTVTSPINDESRLQDDIDTSIFANNVVGIQVTGWNEVDLQSDISVPTDGEGGIILQDVVSSRKEGGKDGLASGAVAGIVITVLLALAAVVAMLVVRQRRRSAAAYFSKSDDNMGDNTTYNEKAYDLSLYMNEHPNGTGLSTFEENEMIGNVDPVESTAAAGLANVAADVADAALEQNDTTCCSFGAGGAANEGICQR